MLQSIRLTDSVVIFENGTGNGSISIEINNQVGEFKYNWSNGEKNYSIDSLKEGGYCCSVTNRARCEKVFCFNIELVTSTSILIDEEIIIFPNPLKESTGVEIKYNGNEYDVKIHINKPEFDC